MKYGKYFTTGVLKPDTKNKKGFVTSTRNLEGFGGGHLSVDCIYIHKPQLMITQPHQHEFPQYLHFFSGNADDASDFDAVIEVTLGEEAELHLVTVPTALYVPAGLPHGPLNFKTVNKPVLFIDIAVTGSYSRVGNTPD